MFGLREGKEENWQSCFESELNKGLRSACLLIIVFHKTFSFTLCSLYFSVNIES